MGLLDAAKAASANNALTSTLRYLPFAELHDDTIIMKDNGLRAVLEVSAINFSLKSEEEQDSIIATYQSFLNSLEFPVQILVKSKKLDLDEYLANLDKVAMKQSNPLLKNQTEDYIQFVSKLVEYADIMEKKFYVVIPYDSALGGTQKNMFKLFMSAISPDDSVTKYKSRKKQFASFKKTLQQRINVIQSGLENCSLSTRLLTTKELIELFYGSYNPQTSLEVKLKEINVAEPQPKDKVIPTKKELEKNAPTANEDKKTSPEQTTQKTEENKKQEAPAVNEQAENTQISQGTKTHEVAEKEKAPAPEAVKPTDTNAPSA